MPRLVHLAGVRGGQEQTHCLSMETIADLPYVPAEARAVIGELC